MHLMFSVVVA